MAKKKPESKKSKGLRAIAKFIEAQGWNVIVIGPARIEQDIGAREFCYRLSVDFTGAKKQAK